MRCYCCSSLPYSACCEPFLTHRERPGTPEQLMRSRFSAYAVRNFEYVLATYSHEKRIGLTIAQLTDSAGKAKWFALQVANSTYAQPTSSEGRSFPSSSRSEDVSDRSNIPMQGTVEFTAYFFEDGSLFQLHETSNFVKENDRWYYHDGILHDDCGKLKYPRNLPCLCNSGKKFKQCCATKVR